MFTVWQKCDRCKKWCACERVTGVCELCMTEVCYRCGESNPAVLVHCSQCKKLVCLKHQIGAPHASLCDGCTEPLLHRENARFHHAMKIGGCFVAESEN